MSDADSPPPGTELVLYQTERGIRIDVRLDEGTVWLTQAQMAELFQTSVPNVNMHLSAIYEDGELGERATVKPYLIVRQEGTRQVQRSVQHYNLDAILAVGYRVRSTRGTQFRQAVPHKRRFSGIAAREVFIRGALRAQRVHRTDAFCCLRDLSWLAPRPILQLEAVGRAVV